MKLSDLKKGQRAVIASIHEGNDEEQKKVSRRLIEMGMLEGEQVEIAHEAPVSKDPIAVRVRGELLGVGRNEAKLVEVKEIAS